MTDPNLLLMQTIKKNFGEEIEAACAVSSLPPEFLAALIANESGGNPAAIRFEKSVLLQVWEVIQGRADHFGSINKKAIQQWLPSDSFWSVAPLVDGLATSWGLTQIMGYELITFDGRIHDLEVPATSLYHSVRMLEDFAKTWKLDIPNALRSLFNCWNTGRPHNAATTDPKYVLNGLARMQIYASLPDEPPKAISA